MDQKTTGIILTIAAVLLCGCPGLFSLFFGGLMALVSFVPNANIDVYGSNDPQSALTFGLGALCLGVLFVAIPVVVGVLTLRRKPTPAASSDEPLPPAI